MGKIRTVLLATVILLATVLSGSASAGPRTSLTLTAGQTTVRLLCQPAGGSHPDAKNACRAIKTAHGDFDELPDSPTFAACTMEYRPVVATARGTWHGHHVRWKHK